ncbi:MAG: Ig-like domain-containing protein, partial [Gemmatimonadaceae bacterium]|nr:Ig-like domain-containing protein [Gemmatimonadaceae bacterium]
PIVNDTARGTLTLPVGTGRVVTAEAFDASGVATYRGSRTVTVAAGTNTGLTLTLLPLLGDVPVTAVVGRLSVSLTASAASVAAGGTVQLTPEVRDALNAVVAVPVTYALSRPPAAAVSAAGVVTALDTGSVTVTATAFGSAASTTISITPGVILETLAVTDTLLVASGTSNADVVLRHPVGIDSVQVSSTPPGGTGAPVGCSSLVPANGTRTAGMFRCPLTFAAGAATGVWRVSTLRVFVGATPTVLDSVALRNRGASASVRIAP